MSAYAHPEAIVENEWLAAHLADPKVRVAEIDYDPVANYDLGHIPGAVLFDWRKDINDPVARDILSGEAFQHLFQKAGVDPDTTVVLYGDFNNWFAAFAYWVFTYYGAKNLKLLNGGRKKWIAEDRPLTKDPPHPPTGKFVASHPNPKLRAYLDDVRNGLPKVKQGQLHLVDVRGPKEFSGEITAPPSTRPSMRSAGATSPGRRTSPGPRRSGRTGRSSPGRSWRRSTEAKGSHRRPPSSPTAGSGSARATRGSS